MKSDRPRVPPPPHDLERELADADRRIAAGEQRLARQAALVARLAGQDRETSLAEMLLKEIDRGLKLMRQHRDMIILRLSQSCS